MMDIQIPFIFVSLFSLASVLLIFIYKFGIKEKSYEEALAEQRQQTHILLGIKPKSKEKKGKKPAKKLQTKEKSVSEESENVDTAESEQAEPNVKKPHVEFKEVAEDAAVKSVANKKQAKKEKVRPILIHKESESVKVVAVETSAAPANHFEELHPKDDFELFRSTSGEDAGKEEPEKHTPKVEPETSKQIHNKKQDVDATAVPKENGPPVVTASVNGIIANTGKEKKKKKSEFNTLQQLAAGDSNGPNMAVLLSLVRKAELSRSEVQILIDLLLNKQHEAPAVVDEWSEGKSDPVQKLKKQLAEKEKLLAEEQQAVAGAQSKLREIRSEHQNEKTVLQQKIRSMEEMIHTKQMEATRNHQQVQQLQAQVKEEVVKYHKLREEHAALQIQKQQYEMRLGQAQDSNAIIGQLQNEVQELTTINGQLQMELGRLTEENVVEKERGQSYIVQLNNFQKELEQKNERSRQLEETRLKLEHDLETFLKQEGELKAEIARLTSVIQQQNEEVRRLEHGAKQYHDELQKSKEESTKVIGQLTNELRRAQEEKLTHVNGSLQENKQREVEILNLHNELASVKVQLSQTEKESEVELRAANAVAEKLREELRDLKVQFEEEKTKLEEQKTKNNELRTKNWKVMEALNAAESRIKNTSIFKTKSDEEVQREFIQRLFPEIKDPEISNSETFKVEGEKFIRKYVENLRKQQQVEDNNDCDVHQLKLQLQHYKNVIDNTEKMLNKLQKHIEQEEINWRMQLAAKTAELDSVKSSHGQELQKLTLLQLELKKEQEEKKRLFVQLQQFQNDAQAQNSSNGLH